MAEKFPKKESLKGFEDEFLLHQYCKIERRSKPKNKNKKDMNNQKKKKKIKSPKTHVVK